MTDQTGWMPRLFGHRFCYGVAPMSFHQNLNYAFFSAIECTVDNYCGTCVAGGVHMLGLHVTTAPRRHDYHQPVLESFTFVPYTTSLNPGSLDESLVKYSELCGDCSLKGLQSLLTKHGSNGLKNKQQIETLVSAAVADQKNMVSDAQNGLESKLLNDIDLAHEKHHGCLEVLKSVFDVDYCENFTDVVDNVVKSKSEMLKSDMLLGHLHKTDNLKPCLDIVVENTLSKNLKVLEVDNTGMVDVAGPLLDSHPLLNVSYMVATTDTDTATQLAETDGVSDVVKWKPCDVLPGNFKKTHLVIANNITRKQVNIRQSLLSMADCVDDGGFLLVQEVTKNFHVALPLDGLCFEWECNDMNERTSGIYCDACKWRQIFSELGLEVIYEVSDNIYSSVFLLKKQTHSSLEIQTVLDVSSTDCDWVEELKSKMSECQSKSKGENLWLKADGHASGIMGMVNCLRQEPGGDKIR